MKLIFFIIVLVLFMGVASPVIAFDGQRGGFIIGGLGGVALNLWNQTVDSNASDMETDFAVHTDFRIGGGFKGGKIMLYYGNIVNWFGMDLVSWAAWDMSLPNIGV
jgi:hypothetical protein